MSESLENVILMIEDNREQFTSVENVIADYFLSNNKVLDINELAKHLAVSPSSITRFSHKMGLDNYKELIFLYKKYLNNLNNQVSQYSIDVVNSYMAIAQRTSDNYDENAIQYFCNQLYDSRTIFFWGLGFNSFVGQDLEFKFSRLGKIIQQFSNQQSIALNSNFLTEGDVLVISSISANDSSILESIQCAYKKGAQILLMTANKKSPYIPYCKSVMYVARFSPEESLGNISPQVPMLINLDIIYSKYINAHQFDRGKWKKSELILKSDRRIKYK